MELYRLSSIREKLFVIVRVSENNLSKKDKSFIIPDGALFGGLGVALIGLVALLFRFSKGGGIGSGGGGCGG